MGREQVYLPSVSVQLAFVLSLMDDIGDGTAEDACLLQIPDGDSVLAIHTSSQHVIFYSCNSSGGVRRRHEAFADISCIASLDMSGSAFTPAGDSLCPTTASPDIYQSLRQNRPYLAQGPFPDLSVTTKLTGT